jgi:hypothetical protein
MSATLKKKPFVPECFNCGSASEKLQKCGRCLKAVYCGKQCQTKAWECHEQICNLRVAIAKNERAPPAALSSKVDAKYPEKMSHPNSKSKIGQLHSLSKNLASLQISSAQNMFIEGKRGRTEYERASIPDNSAIQNRKRMKLADETERQNQLMNDFQQRDVVMDDLLSKEKNKTMDNYIKSPTQRAELEGDLSFYSACADVHDDLLFLLMDYESISQNHCPDAVDIQIARIYELIIKIEKRCQVVTVDLTSFADYVTIKYNIIIGHTEIFDDYGNSIPPDTQNQTTSLNVLRAKIRKELIEIRDEIMKYLLPLLVKQCSTYYTLDTRATQDIKKSTSEIFGNSVTDYFQGLRLKHAYRDTLDQNDTIGRLLQLLEGIRSGEGLVFYILKLTAEGLWKIGRATANLFSYAWTTTRTVVSDVRNKRPVTADKAAVAFAVGVILGIAIFAAFNAGAVGATVAFATVTLPSTVVAFWTGTSSYFLASLRYLCTIMDLPFLGAFVRANISNLITKVILRFTRADSMLDPAARTGRSAEFIRFIRPYVPRIAETIVNLILRLACGSTVSQYIDVAPIDAVTEQSGILALNPTIDDWGMYRASATLGNSNQSVRGLVVHTDDNNIYVQILNGPLNAKIAKISKIGDTNNGVTWIDGALGREVEMRNTSAFILDDDAVAALPDSAKEPIYTKEKFDMIFAVEGVDEATERMIKKNARNVRVAISTIGLRLGAGAFLFMIAGLSSQITNFASMF